MKLRALLRQIQNNILFSEGDINKLFYDLIDKYKLILNNKKIYINQDEYYSSFLFETDKLSIYLHYWEKIDYCYIEIVTNFDAFNIFDYIRNFLKANYWKVLGYEK